MSIVVPFDPPAVVPTLMFVPVAFNHEPARVAIGVAIRVTIVLHYDGLLADRRCDSNLGLIAVPLLNHDRRWWADHQPGRQRKREAEAEIDAARVRRRSGSD